MSASMDQPVVRLSRGNLLLAYVSGSYGFGFQSMASFIVPLRAQELQAPLALIGLIVGAGALVPALLSVASGELSDRIGARRTYVLGTAVSAVVALLAWPADNYWLLLPLQLVMGLSRSTAWVASQAYVTSLGTPEERPVHAGRLSFTTNAGTFVAPLLIGIVADQVGYQNSFLFMGLFTLGYTLMGLALPEIRIVRGTRNRGSSAGFGTAFGLLRTRGIQVIMMLTFVRLWNGSGWRAFFPLFLQSAGFSNVLIGSVLSANAAVSTVTALWAAPLARRTSNEVATAIALGLGAFGTALSPFVTWVPAVYLPAAFIGTGVGISLPLLMAGVSSEVPADQRGVALGLRMSLNQAASTMAPVVVGLLAPLGLAVALVASAAFSWALLSAAMLMYASDRRGRAASSPPPSGVAG